MIMFTILLITFLVLLATTILAISIGGAGFLIIFGDVIVCIILIAWIIKRRIQRKKK